MQSIALKCRDGFFFKDGRGWSTSTVNRAGSFDWPFPQTVLGILRGAVGRALEDRTGTSFSKQEWVRHTAAVELGVTLPLRRAAGAPWSWNAGHRMWPVPADALYLEGEERVRRLEPAKERSVMTLGRGDDPALEALSWPHLDANAKPLTPPRWWSNAQFTAWLRGEPVLIEKGLSRIGQPRRTDVRLAVSPETFTATESMLYSIEVIEPWDGEHEWAIGASASLPPDAAEIALDKQLYVFGGNGRIGEADALNDGVFAMENDLHSDGVRSIRLHVVTPTLFERGWLPDGFAPIESQFVGVLPGVNGRVLLRSAMVPRPIHWSGWSMEKGGPRVTKRLVPPGATYVFEREDGEAFTADEQRALWLASWGQDTSTGLGRVVAGVSKG